ncbi:MAG TPA: chemotaxis protein CheB [Candidatus Thermoplasmatota archaeon]|nr:chemotaxis protein CheB [Candidatus Thermoplasmatota archaeon]
MKPRVLVVDDSSFVRFAVARLLRQAGIDVVGFARDGAEAVKMNLELEPDVIVMDLQMPRLNGVEALARIRERRPVPVLVFASMTGEGASLGVQALAEGAVDLVPKSEAGEVATDLPARVWALATAQAHDEEQDLPAGPARSPRLITIASSTGGPPCVEAILTSLPRNLAVPIAVAQHMPAGFTNAFAKRLDTLCDLHVFEGTDGALLEPGSACILPGGAVTTVEALEGGGNRFELTVRPGGSLPGAKPNASALFLSALGATGGALCAAVLTGMGADGGDAVPALVASGATVIAQHPSEAVISSMPNAAIAGGAQWVDRVRDIPDRFLSLLPRRLEGYR